MISFFFTTDKNLTQSIFEIHSAILADLHPITTKRMLQSNSLFNQNYSYSDIDNQNLGNITQSIRNTLVNYEQYISSKLGEGQVYNAHTSSFNISISKYSTIAPRPFSVNFTDPSNRYSYSFPLQQALMTTDRQSLSILTFSGNPFYGQTFLNQTPSSQNALYFAYRDTNGNYLGSSYVQGLINISFPFQYSPFIFLPNVSVCGYIS